MIFWTTKRVPWNSSCFFEMAVSKFEFFCGPVVEYGYDRGADNYDSTGDVCFLADDLARLMYDGVEQWDKFMILGRRQYWSLIDLIFFELHLS